jgi:hypothetical protein
VTQHYKIVWHHELADEPTLIFSEVSAGAEIRKVEIYRHGRHDYADASHSTGSTLLAETQMPALEEINSDPQFAATEISANEFEIAWLLATRGRFQDQD